MWKILFIRVIEKLNHITDNTLHISEWSRNKLIWFMAWVTSTKLLHKSSKSHRITYIHHISYIYLLTEVPKHLVFNHMDFHSKYYV